MKILAHIHGYPPYHNAGAEWMLHAILVLLQQRGHECRVLVPTKDNYEFEGVKVFKDNRENISNLYVWCDLAMSHLQLTGAVISNSRRAGKPHFHIVHNSTPYSDVARCLPSWMIYNTDWLQQLHKNSYVHRGCVVHPPVIPSKYETETTREYITLVNLWENKGGKILQQIAKALPQYQFLGVEGGYGGQEIDRSIQNITYISNTPNMRNEVYAKTKILIMPSDYESYGRVAIEAICSGIPVVCTDTPGLKEALKESGIYISDRKNIQSWIDELKKLCEDSKYYTEISYICKARSSEISEQTTPEIDRLENLMKSAMNSFVLLPDKPKNVKVTTSSVQLRALKSFYDIRSHRKGEVWEETNTTRAEQWINHNLCEIYGSDVIAPPNGTTLGNVIEIPEQKFPVIEIPEEKLPVKEIKKPGRKKKEAV